ncbi:MAG: tungstate ABC transporter ATP-binding protein WtpC [Methanomicrobiales archaeon]
MLEVHNLSKDLGEFVLRDVSLDVHDGEYLIIIGPTGAGKTILLEILAGIYPPDAGKIVLNHRDITRLPARDRNICMVYQDYMLFPHLTVEQNIGFGLKNRKVPREEIDAQVQEAASLFDIGHLLHRYPDTLSGGEQQRTAISRAIVMNPNLLLLDEPLSALDSQTREKLRSELKRLHATYDTTVIHITHNFEEVFSLADRVAIMNEGQILQIGTPDEVFRQPECEFTARFVGVGNLFSGRITGRENGISAIDIEGITIYSTPGDQDGEVSVSIRPEDLLISHESPSISARNRLPGTVTDVVDNGTLVRLYIDVGIPFVAVMTRQGFHEMGIGEGSRIWIAFKATSVHVF